MPSGKYFMHIKDENNFNTTITGTEGNLGLDWTDTKVWRG
jgi:hypothetical protein